MYIKKPFFSVVMPLYNKESYIARAINSVLRQSFMDFELIIINDASTDNSLKNVLKFNDSRIRILQRKQPGPGGYAARNLGVAKANSEWIAFLDSDDEWRMDHLKEMHTLIIRNSNAGLLCSAWETVEMGGLRFINSHTKMFQNKGTHEFGLKEYLIRSSRGNSPLCASVVVIKRDIFLSAGGFPEELFLRGGDTDTWLRIMIQDIKAIWSPHIGAIYYRNSTNMITKKITHNIKNMSLLKTINTYLSEHHSKNMKKYLMLFYNHYKKFGIRDMARKGTLTISSVKKLSYQYEPIKYMFYLIYSILPRCMMQWFSNSFLKLKSLLNNFK